MPTDIPLRVHIVRSDQWAGDAEVKTPEFRQYGIYKGLEPCEGEHAVWRYLRSSKAYPHPLYDGQDRIDHYWELSIYESLRFPSLGFLRRLIPPLGRGSKK